MTPINWVAAKLPKLECKAHKPHGALNVYVWDHNTGNAGWTWIEGEQRELFPYDHASHDVWHGPCDCAGVGVGLGVELLSTRPLWKSLEDKIRSSFGPDTPVKLEKWKPINYMAPCLWKSLADKRRKSGFDPKTGTPMREAA